MRGRGGSYNFFLGLTLALAFVLNAASPACKFISGGGPALMEICAEDGSLKSIPFPAGLNPFEDKSKQHNHVKSLNDCAFCFAQTNIQGYGGASLAVVSAPIQDTANPTLANRAAPIKSSFRAAHAPRAPPVTQI